MALPRVLPDPILPPLTDGPQLRWGVLAPGFIAGMFAATLHQNTHQRIVAVASRDAERAERFATRFEIPTHYASYEHLVADPQVDIVYIAAPHTQHLPLATLALEAGKHVLVEKPLAATAAEAREIAAIAARTGRFAMEAMHSRFHPKTTIVEQLLADEALGALTLVQAEIGLGGVVRDPSARLFDPALGGGAALDIGVYPLWFHRFALGQPTRLEVSGTHAMTGVEDQFNATLHHDDDALGLVSATLRTWTDSHATIAGTAGRIRFDSRLPQPGSLELVDDANKLVARYEDTTGIVGIEGLCRQAAWAAQHIADGLVESPMHPLSTSIDVLDTIDQIRRELGAEGAPR